MIEPINSASLTSRYTPPSTPVRCAIALAATVGLVISALLAYRSLSGAAMPGCGAGSACDEVLGSAWSSVLGVPVSVPAMMVYVVVLAGLMHVGSGASARKQRIVWPLLIIAAGLLLAAGAWFMAVQIQVIGHLCKWCTAAHACGTATAAALLYVAPIGQRRVLTDEPLDPLLIARPVAAGLLALACMLTAGMAVLQWAVPGKGVVVARFGGVVGRPGDMPMLGSADAPHVLLYLFDYTCPHCRAMHSQLEEVRQRYGDQVVIVLMPTPLDAACNPAVRETEPRHQGACELARLALATWQASPEVFVQVNDWLFEPEQPRTATEARQHVASLIGAGALDDLLATGWADEQLRQNVELYRGTGGGVLPRLVAGQLIIAGRPGEAADLFKILEQDLGLQPR